MVKIPVFLSSQSLSGELRNVGDGSRLRCVHGKADTNAISHVCVHVCTVASAQCSGFIVYDTSAIATI